MQSANLKAGSEPIVALNDEAGVFLTLAQRIDGAAVGWAPSTVFMLHDGLQTRFGHLLGPCADEATNTLIEVATTPRTS